jgi:hypothetical protein
MRRSSSTPTHSANASATDLGSAGRQLAGGGPAGEGGSWGKRLICEEFLVEPPGGLSVS